MPRASTALLRALRLRCPACGSRPIFVTWTRMCPSCTNCGLQLERHERGYWVGAYFFNLLAAEAVFAGFFLLVVAATWPTPPWRLLHIGTIVLMLLTPLLFFPFSKTLFLAFDLLVRPPDPDDYDEPREAGLNARRERPRRR